MLQKTTDWLPVLTCLFVIMSCTQAEESHRSSSELSASESRLALLEKNPDAHPLIVMRLLKFKSNDGLKEYEEFLKSYLPVLRELGGESLFLGSATPYKLDYESSHELFGLRHSPWDLLVIERFPSRKDLRKLGDIKAYQQAESALQRHLEDIAIYALNGRLHGGNGRSLADTVVAPEFPDGDELFEINLLQFKPNGGEAKYYNEYAKHVLPMIDHAGAKVIYGLEAELMLAGDERYDRAVLVMYPSEEAFHQMVTSEAYQAISPKREDALVVGHLFGFSNAGRRLKTMQQE